MKRALLAVLLCVSSGLAGAQTTIKIAFTWTPSAQTAAGGATAMQSQINTLISAINTRYGLAGAAFSPVFPFHAATTSPDEIKGIAYQYQWASDSPESADQRGDYTGASLSVHIWNGTGSRVSPKAGSTDAVNTFSTVSYATMSADLEGAINAQFGVDPTKGYAARSRIYPSDPAYQIVTDNAICYHSFEGTALPSSTVVPYLPYWWVGSVTSSQSGTPEVACEAYRQYIVTHGSSSSTYAASSVIPPGTYYVCQLWNNASPRVGTGQIVIDYNSNPGSGTVACSTEGVLNTYSSPTRFWPGTAFPAGDATHNNLATIGARVTPLFNMALRNGSLKSRAREIQHWWWADWMKWR